MGVVVPASVLFNKVGLHSRIWGTGLVGGKKSENLDPE